MISTKRKIRFFIFIIIFLIISPIVILYARGDIFSNGLNFRKTGGIYLMSLPSDAEIYINNKLVKKSNFFIRDFLIKNLRSGDYSVLVQREGYNPWRKEINVEDNLVTDARVFMLKSNIERREIFSEISEDKEGTSTIKKIKNAEYYDLMEIFSRDIDISNASSSNITKLQLGTKESPFIAKKVGLWREEGKVYVEWLGKKESAPDIFCEKTECKYLLTLFDLGSELKNIAFFPGLEDVIVVSSGRTVFAVEVEENKDKRIQELYLGKAPDFRIINEVIYVKDGKQLFEIIID